MHTSFYQSTEVDLDLSLLLPLLEERSGFSSKKKSQITAETTKWPDKSVTLWVIIVFSKSCIIPPMADR